MAASPHRHEKLIRPGQLLRWGVVVLAMLLSLVCLIFQVIIAPVLLLSVAAIMAVVNLIPHRDLGV
ncbi:MAG TPA: hypothetical protein VE994_20835 [Terriglobales bacterium]|nr:hypothetical protein [Terriglobales bacterium]